MSMTMIIMMAMVMVLIFFYFCFFFLVFVFTLLFLLFFVVCLFVVEGFLLFFSGEGRIMNCEVVFERKQSYSPLSLSAPSSLYPLNFPCLYPPLPLLLPHSPRPLIFLLNERISDPHGCDLTM